ncbi:MAG: cupin domain-containing protein [Acholeplasmataceae bacterium]|nr:cupin domain-containing protein [Acholeplasmataceae bacterium]
MIKKNLYDLPQSCNKYNILARTLVDHKHATMKELFLEKGQMIPEHSFPFDVTFFILKGHGSIKIGDEIVEVNENDVVLCPPNTKMSVYANDDHTLSFLNIKTPGLKSLE